MTDVVTVGAPVEDWLATQRAALLASLILGKLRGAGGGHCLRVDFLGRREAEAVCQQLREDEASLADRGLQAYVLSTALDAKGDHLAVTADRAIEMRNRKRGILCLFVPADLVDATISSLGNSFAAIDGRDLLGEAFDEVFDELSSQARALLRAIQLELRGSARVSDDDLLDLALVARDLEAEGRADRVGLELWRVGLIVDARPDFDRYLPANRRAVQVLARPQQLTASFRDRIADLGVHEKTARRLDVFFANRAMHDVRGWSRDLLELDSRGEPRTFDSWIFPEIVSTDLEAVRVRPFTDVSGAAQNFSKLDQPDGPGGTLYAHCGPRAVVSVHWSTEPVHPRNVHAWRVSIEPAIEEGEFEADDLFFDLPSREIKGTSRTARIKLDMEFDDPPEYSVRVRVVAVDETGNEIRDSDGAPIADVSEDFYLTDKERQVAVKAGERRRTVPSLAYGRLHTAVNAKEDEIELTQPSWATTRGICYFSIRANERTVLNVAASPLLLALQQRSLSEPHTGGRYRLNLDEIVPASDDAVDLVPVGAATEGAWADFWQARKSFFDRLRRAHPRDRVEAADWTPELTNAALAHARAYGGLLDTLRSDSYTEEEGVSLREALSIDTVYVRLDVGNETEEAVVVLPTHPLRTLWYASHAALLHHWEGQVLPLQRRERKAVVDLEALKDLVPANLPAFVHRPTEGEPFVFFQNVGLYYAVALPGHVPDPRRRLLDVAQVLGLETEVEDADDERPERLASHIADFRTSHPYADPLQVTLVNPDHGEFFADAVVTLFRKQTRTEGETPLPDSPRINLDAYVIDRGATGLRGLDLLRGALQERSTATPTDPLQPALASAIRPFSELESSAPRESHLSIVSDTSRPSVLGVLDVTAEGGAGSFSLYGLLTRFVSSFHVGEGRVDWYHRILTTPAERPDTHPAGPRFGETLIEAHRHYLRASGSLLNPSHPEAVPGLHVAVSEQQAAMLERLHGHTDWVVTVDRFFGAEYYDSPRDGLLGQVARKYLLDYRPEFVEGLGHRMIVTTARRDEVTVVLQRAMIELGLAAVESSVGQLLAHLKTVSGRLALQALSHTSSATASVSLGVVTAWLEAHGRLAQTIMVPVDIHPELFWAGGNGAVGLGERRCDLALFTLRRGIVEATFIEVKWRRPPLGNIDDLVQDMALQMESTGRAVEDRFFNLDRVDGALQRARLANALRFYCDRAVRYGLMSPEVAGSFGSHLTRLEKAGLEFRPRYEGFIVSLDEPRRTPSICDDVTVRVLTREDFDEASAELADDSVSGDGHGLERQGEDVGPPGSFGYAGGEEASSAFMPMTGSAAVTTSEAARGSADGVRLEPPNVLGAESPQSDSSIEAISVPLGQVGSAEVVWKPSVEGSPHLFITGIPGQGKSWTVIRLLQSLATQGVPALIFDFHGQLAGNNPYAQLAEPSIIDAARGLPFSPFEYSGEANTPTGMNATAMAVSEIFAYVCRLGDIQRDALYQAIQGAYTSYGLRPGAAVPTPEGFPTLEDVARRIKQAEQRQKTQNLSARCRILLEMDLFRPPNGVGVDFIRLAQQGLAVDLSKLYSEELQMAAGAFLLRKVYRDMFSWGMADRLRLAIVLDEAHRLARDVTLPKIMKEGRKFGVVVVLASQGLGDFHQDVVGNAGTKVAFRANYPDSRKIGGFFHVKTGADARVIVESLSVGHALVQTPEMQVAARVAMYPPDVRAKAAQPR